MQVLLRILLRVTAVWHCGSLEQLIGYVVRIMSTADRDAVADPLVLPAVKKRLIPAV